MDVQTIEITIKVYLQEIRIRLDKAVSIAKAAEACSNAGNVEKGIEIALDVEQLIYEASTLLNAASLVNRIGVKQQ
jgi:hypothetical protein